MSKVRLTVELEYSDLGWALHVARSLNSILSGSLEVTMMTSIDVIQDDQTTLRIAQIFPDGQERDNPV